mmetsp:Transcript_69899/g.194394  ORF Transcript_69899/g.194394 Transcript_69899/m.194394 type:complete len:260 (-) Transcript_69899:134-913(-)
MVCPSFLAEAIHPPVHRNAAAAHHRDGVAHLRRHSDRELGRPPEAATAKHHLRVFTALGVIIEALRVGGPAPCHPLGEVELLYDVGMPLVEVEGSRVQPHVRKLLVQRFDGGGRPSHDNLKLYRVNIAEVHLLLGRLAATPLHMAKHDSLVAGGASTPRRHLRHEATLLPALVEHRLRWRSEPRTDICFWERRELYRGAQHVTTQQDRIRDVRQASFERPHEEFLWVPTIMLLQWRVHRHQHSHRGPAATPRTTSLLPN